MKKKSIVFSLFIFLAFLSFLYPSTLDKIEEIENIVSKDVKSFYLESKGVKKTVYTGSYIDFSEFSLKALIRGKENFLGVKVLGKPLYLDLTLGSRGRSIVDVFVDGVKVRTIVIDGGDGYYKERSFKLKLVSKVEKRIYELRFSVKNEGFYPQRGDYWPRRSKPLEKDEGSYFRLIKAELLYPDAESIHSRVKDWINSMKVAYYLLNPELVRKTFTGKPYKIEDKRRVSKKRIKKLNKILKKAISFLSKDVLLGKDKERIILSLKKSYSLSKPLRRYAKKFRVYLIGNAHIDIAWLWRISETKHVARNTYRTVLENMKEYPELFYAQSQAITYEWMEKEYPDVFKEIKKRVKEGRWEIVGGMWVEPDCNLISGESWVRQILYGKKYFREKFGVDVKLGWNPDSFGYNWNMPQIYKKSGIDYFVTQKIWWNDTTVFPYYAFYWKGVDGEELLTYFPPMGYTSRVRLIPTVKALSTFEAVTGEKEALILYGLGDHGGGPNREILNRIRRYKRLYIAPQFIHSRAEDFIKRIPKKFKNIPVWSDELYLEYHRGTYTTQAKIKKNNRLSETLSQQTEKFTSVAYLFGKSYPFKKLYSAWKIILTNQFHDILPGSSITPVYRDALTSYKKAKSILEKELKGSLDFLARKIGIKKKGIPVVVFNSLSFKRTDAVEVCVKELPSKFYIEDFKGEEVPYEVDGSCREGKKIVFLARNIPSLGYKLFYIKEGEGKKKFEPLKAGEYYAENKFLKIEFDPCSGNIKSIFYKPLSFEFVKEGDSANKLIVYEDMPERWDAWNIGYTGRFWEIKKADSVKLIKATPLRVVFEVKRSFLGLSKSRYSPTEYFPSSFFNQRIILWRGIKRVDIVNNFDWWEEHALLKAEFPLNIESDYATYEIPFSAIKRTTSFKTLWEKARFEVPALRWGDLSDGKKGLSLLNDSKYGYDIHKSTIKLSLLRAPKWPDPMADRGKHTFTYSLYPHKGGFDDADTVKEGLSLNTKLIAVLTDSHGGELPEEMSFFGVKSDSVIVDTVKLSEDGKGIILRLYESEGRPQSIEVKLFREPKAVYLTNLIEDIEKKLSPSGVLRLEFKKFEIKTIKLIF